MFRLWQRLRSLRGLMDTVGSGRLENRGAAVTSANGPRRSGEKPVNRVNFCRASAHIHTQQQNKQWQGREELQTPHPACVKINLLKGGDVFVSSAIMETSMATPHRRTICVLIKEFHYTADTSGTHGQFLCVPEALCGALLMALMETRFEVKIHFTAIIVCPPCACHQTAELYFASWYSNTMYLATW